MSVKTKAAKVKAAKRRAPPQMTGPVLTGSGPIEPMSILLPYQIKYLNDKSQLKILEKSRRIGGTYVQALEDVLDCKETPGLKVWFSSADMTAGSEYLDYVQFWIRSIDALTIAIVTEVNLEGTSELQFADEANDFKARVVEFSNGSKITILSSSPTAFRSKGGKVVWDEAAHHKSDRKMWAAAQPVATWGHSIRVLSTHNGRKTVFYQLCNPSNSQEVDPDDLDPESEEEMLFSKHRVTIHDAVDQGMLDKVLRRKATDLDKKRWLKRQRRMCLTEDQWQEEFLCNAIDESTALLTYEAIANCERSDLSTLESGLSIDPDQPDRRNLFLGMDIGRHNHPSVIYVGELCGTTIETRHVKAFTKTKFRTQLEYVNELMKLYPITRGCIDGTGLGMMLAEEAQEQHGGRIESVTFSAKTNEDLAIKLVKEFEDVTVRIPVDGKQRESLHSIRCIVTTAGNKRYDAPANDKNGHGDHFWALALMVHAARDPNAGPTWVCSSSTLPTDDREKSWATSYDKV